MEILNITDSFKNQNKRKRRKIKMYRKTKQEKQGISLIVLVITIIVIIIIAAAVILGLTKSNPINNSKISQLVQSRDNIKSSITMYLSKVASNTQGSFTNIQILTGLLGVPDKEDPIIRQGAEKYKLVYGKNSTPSYNTQTKIMYTQRTEVKLENGGTKFLYQIDPVAYKTQTENALDSAMFADAAWYVDPEDTQVYLIFNNKGSYPSWMLENGVIADPTLLGMLGKLSIEDETNESAKIKAENNVTEDSKPDTPIGSTTSEGVPIPKGFSVSSTNNTLAKGVVITDNTTADEYVWVPVPDISKFVRSDWQSWSGSGEPGTPSSDCKELTTTEEYQAMYNSVKTYKGFYIARYEAGKPDGVSIKTDGSVKPVSKAGKAGWNNIPWSVSGTDPDDSSYAGDPNQNGAVKVARSVYPKDGNAKVVSTLIYGVQWDAAMRYVSGVVNTTQSGNPLYIKNSKGMGWYYDNTGNILQQTGKPMMHNGEVLNTSKGIYDLGGNVYEWTMEAYSTSHRAVRGGSYGSNGVSYPVSSRYNYSSTYTGTDYGFRVALYLK